MSGIRTKGK